MSPDTKRNYLAVGLQPGKQFEPDGNMKVYLFNWKTETEKCCIETGNMFNSWPCTQAFCTKSTESLHGYKAILFIPHTALNYAHLT